MDNRGWISVSLLVDISSRYFDQPAKLSLGLFLHINRYECQIFINILPPLVLCFNINQKSINPGKAELCYRDSLTKLY